MEREREKKNEQANGTFSIRANAIANLTWKFDIKTTSQTSDQNYSPKLHSDKFMEAKLFGRGWTWTKRPMLFLWKALFELMALSFNDFLILLIFMSVTRGCSSNGNTRTMLNVNGNSFGYIDFLKRWRLIFIKYECQLASWVNNFWTIY